MPAHGAGQHHAFDVAADRGDLLGRHRVVDPLDVLLDDRALVEVGGDVVRGRADQLDAARMGLEVRLGALEAGQEAVVDVDRPALQRGAEIGRQDLHVARQHHEIDALVLDDGFDPLLLCPLGGGVAAGGQRQVVERDAVAIGQAGERGVVRHDGRDVDVELAALPAEQQVVQAVAVLADHQQQARSLGHGVEPCIHAVLRADMREQVLEHGRGGHVRRRLEMHPHEEQAGGVVTLDIAELL